MATITRSRSISRRKVLAGMSAGLAATAVPLSAQALAPNSALPLPVAWNIPHDNETMATRLCTEMHGKIAARLDEIIADPMIDGEQTSLALMEARCPGCKERVEPATSRISAVIPQWKGHISGPVKFGVKA